MNNSMLMLIVASVVALSTVGLVVFLVLKKRARQKKSGLPSSEAQSGLITDLPGEGEGAGSEATALVDLPVAKEMPVSESLDGVDESEASETPQVLQPVSVAADKLEAPTETVVAGLMGEANFAAESVVAAGGTTLPLISLTLEAYSAWMNELEERQRSLLAQAIVQKDDAQRDRLQRELVVMNDKLALLADSYKEEMTCYQQVLETLEMVRDGAREQPDLESAIAQLRCGEAQAAEDFLADLSKQPGSFAVRAAYGSGQLAECRVGLQKALELYRYAVEQEPDNPQYLQAAGRVACSLYDYTAALPWLESFVRLSRENKGDDDNVALVLALAQRELAYTYVLSGQHQKAGQLYKESMVMLARKLGQDHPEMAISWRQIAELQETLGEYDKAVSLYKKSLKILEEKRGPENPVVAGILAKLAALCMELDLEKESVPLYERLVHIQEKTLRATHPQRAISLNSLAEAYRLQGRYADAFSCYQKSLMINEFLHGPEHPAVAAILQELAKLCTSQRQPEKAKEYKDRATAIFNKSVEASEKKSGKKG